MINYFEFQETNVSFSLNPNKNPKSRKNGENNNDDSNSL